MSGNKTVKLNNKVVFYFTLANRLLYVTQPNFIGHNITISMRPYFVNYLYYFFPSFIGIRVNDYFFFTNNSRFLFNLYLP